MEQFIRELATISTFPASQFHLNKKCLVGLPFPILTAWVTMLYLHYLLLSLLYQLYLLYLLYLLYPAVPCCTCCNCCTCCRVGISLFCSFALSLFTLVSLYLKSNKKKMSRFLFLLFRTLFIKELLLRVGFAPFLFSRWIISVGPFGVRETKMLCSLRCCKKSNLLLLLL